MQALNGNFQVIAQKKQLMGKLTAPLPLLCRNQVFLAPQCAYHLESVWGGGKPNAVGICTEVVAKEQKTYRFTKINYL